MTFSNALRFYKHNAFSLGVGSVIVCIHFVVTPAIERSRLSSTESTIIWLIMIAPGYILIMAEPFLEFFHIGTEIMEKSFYFTASFFYGVATGMVVSKYKYLRWMGIILFVLIILFGYFAFIMAGQIFA